MLFVGDHARTGEEQCDALWKGKRRFVQLWRLKEQASYIIRYVLALAYEAIASLSDRLGAMSAQAVRMEE